MGILNIEVISVALDLFKTFFRVKITNLFFCVLHNDNRYISVTIEEEKYVTSPVIARLGRKRSI